MELYLIYLEHFLNVELTSILIGIELICFAELDHGVLADIVIAKLLLVRALLRLDVVWEHHCLIL
jgi:hypothetical protein